jgi:outer membrane lipopolysaccharide assembly protein LptE/RlpB
MKTSSMRTVLSGVAGLALLSLLSGCMGYTLGNTLPPNIRSVAVPVVQNEANEPGLEPVITSAIIAEFQRDGSLKVRPRDQANSVIEVKLTRYDLAPLRYRRDQNTTANEYRLTLRADVTLRRLPGREILADPKDVEGFVDFTSMTDLPSSRREALPKAAADLARRVVKTVVEYW